MISNSRRYVVLGVGVALVMIVLVGSTIWDGHHGTARVAVQSTPTVSPTPTTMPTATVTPTQTPTPVPTPTIAYLSVITDTLTNVAPRPGAKGKVWSPQQRAVLIDQDAQQIYVYEDGKKIKVIPCSSGKPLLDHFTPAWTGRVGAFQGTIFSFGVYADDAWYLFRASGDILIHGAPYVYVNGQKVYQDIDALGHYPNSHGCVRVDPKDADWLTTWNLEGVPMVVLPWRGGFSE